MVSTFRDNGKDPRMSRGPNIVAMSFRDRSVLVSMRICVEKQRKTIFSGEAILHLVFLDDWKTVENRSSQRSRSNKKISRWPCAPSLQSTSSRDRFQFCSVFEQFLNFEQFNSFEFPGLAPKEKSRTMENFEDRWQLEAISKIVRSAKTKHELSFFVNSTTVQI